VAGGGNSVRCGSARLPGAYSESEDGHCHQAMPPTDSGSWRRSWPGRTCWPGWTASAPIRRNRSAPDLPGPPGPAAWRDHRQEDHLRPVEDRRKRGTPVLAVGFILAPCVSVCRPYPVGPSKQIRTLGVEGAFIRLATTGRSHWLWFRHTETLTGWGLSAEGDG
jgi:hypothetical protein